MIEQRVHSIFDKARFIQELGITITKVREGLVETQLVVRDEFRQQHGFVHAGVLATLGDHTAGGACRSATGEKDVLTVEFKINFLRPAAAELLKCRAQVLRAGRGIAVADAEIFAVNDGVEKLVAKLTETVVVIDQA